MKFAHIADTHIRNLKYHDEYRKVFSKMYESLRENKVDYIIHCGDIAHTKTQISPEFVEMASNFFSELGNIAPTYIILGNHDGNLKNSFRQDAITPIISALDHPNLHLLKDAGETGIGNNAVLNVLSVFDEDNWVKPTDDSKINIALYHGAVAGVKTDQGWVMEHGDHDISVFENFDYGFLGDIHKTNQVLDEEGRIRYPGSTIQQNHGETNDKGYLLWDIQDKDTFECQHIAIPNPKPFITVDLTKAGRLPKNTQVPTGARLRLAANYALPLTQIRRAMDIAKTKFKPTSITFLNRASEKGTNIDIDGNIIQEDLRDPIVQEKFIKEFLKDYEVEEDVVNRVFALNRKYNAIVEETDSVKRNIRWKLKSLEWDNLFNYGEGNRVDFEEMNGVVGIFGKNYSGKSSIVDSLLYTLYNTTSKGNRRNFNSINENRQYGEGRVEIEIGNTSLNITRRSEKYVKRLKGEETEEAKTILTFSGKDLATDEEESLNGLDRNDTDKNIRNYFGTMDDFLLTSMASQLGSLSFIGEGSTKRKEILAKFLDLEIFEKKYKLAKEEALELKTILKKLEEIDFDEEIQSCVAELEEHNGEVDKQISLCKKYKEEIHICEHRVQELEKIIESIPAELIDIETVNDELISDEGELERLRLDQLRYKEDINLALDNIDKIAQFVDTLDMDRVEIRKDLVNNRRQDLEDLLRELEQYEAQKQSQEKKIKLLNEVPCGDKYPECKFIKDAFAALESIGITKERMDKIKKEQRENQKALDELNPDQVADYISKYNTVIEKRDNIQNDISKWKLSLSQTENGIITLTSRIDKNKQMVEDYNRDKELIDNLEKHTSGLNKYNKLKDGYLSKLEGCEQALAGLYRENGSIQQKIDSLNEQKQELEDTRENFLAFDLFMNAVGANGVPLDITKNKLPLINAEIAAVLANIVDFQVFVETGDRKLDIFIKHPKHNARPIEMGSGAEKTISSMAIRLALLNVSSLPKGDVFILDEPGTALDEENMEGFVRILDLIKSHFKTVLLISHLDSLKDAVDSQICIDKKDGFAHVNH